jgi:hypothetical protein
MKKPKQLFNAVVTYCDYYFAYNEITDKELMKVYKYFINLKNETVKSAIGPKRYSRAYKRALQNEMQKYPLKITVTPCYEKD